MTNSLRRDAAQYWRFSSIWHKRFNSRRYDTTEELIVGVRDLIRDTLHSKIASRGQDLYSRIINNKRCRKSKPTNNVVPLNTPYHIQGRNLLQIIGNNPANLQKLVGQHCTMVIVDDLSDAGKAALEDAIKHSK